MNFARAIATVGGFTMLSRLTGFARDMLIAAFLGTGMVADAFFVAFKFPNLFRRLFAEGAFNAAFVPLFAGVLESEGPDAARRFAEHAMAVLGWWLLAFVALFEVIMPWAMLGFAPGFAEDPAKLALTVELTRITFPYLLFISLVSLQSGVLNSMGKFAAAAATPVLLNLSLIAALVGLTPHLPGAGHALAVGTTIAGLAQFAWLAISVRRAGVPLAPRLPRMTPRVGLLLRRIVPGAVGAGIYQVNLLVDTMIASLIGPGTVAVLFYADRIAQLPLGIVGVAIGTALLPLLSRQLRAGGMAEAAHSQNRAIEFALLLTVPAMAALVAIGEPLVMVLFQRGAFGPEQTRMTAEALAALSLGLPAYVLNKALTPAFFAREDTATPVKVAGVAMLANIVINLALMKPLAHVGPALATALSSWANVALLAWLLRRHGHLALDERLKRRLPRIVLSSAAMGGALWAASRYMAPLWAGGAAERALGLAALVVGGLALFAALAQLSGAARVSDLKGMMRKAA
ncbi:MAG: murein biosynthesis integral membrane protein MurJ [Alphaproteobacteria bacterium]|nr:murein biosynthesis integral membrane protein MurJ [Alphaproteobacteria bacterium]